MPTSVVAKTLWYQSLQQIKMNHVIWSSLRSSDSNYKWLWRLLRNKREGRLNANWFRNREFLWRGKWALRWPNTEQGDKKAKWGHCLRFSEIYWDIKERKRGGRREEGGFLVQQSTSSQSSCQRIHRHFAQPKQ